MACWLLLSVVIEQWAETAEAASRRAPAAWCVHFGSALLCFTVLLTFSQRPLFASVLSIALWLLLVLVNNAKFRALREPLVFSDFALFSQALRYPRLYLPFLNLRQAVAGGLIAVAGCYLVVAFEPTLPPRVGPERFLGMMVAGSLVSIVLVSTGLRFAAPPSFDPGVDVPRLGLLASLWLYRIAEARSVPEPSGSGCFSAASPAALHKRRRVDPWPDLVVIQSESFFDPRRLWPGIRAGMLRNFDWARMRGISGRLAVPAWGANTMRTEFAFLTGIPAQELGVHRFNPFRRYARRPLPGIAPLLRGLGYRTICIHPHPVGFFGRDRVYPHLGFDQFIDIEGFRGAGKFGPYISDAAVALKIAEVLRTGQAPLFIFAITMENHGPLHLEKVSAADEDALYLAKPPRGFDDLTVYLRHLVNADRMLADLVRLLTESERDAALCFFGDHVPSLPDVYRDLGFADARTDYLIWRKGVAAKEEQDIDVHELGARLLEAAGIGCNTALPVE